MGCLNNLRGIGIVGAAFSALILVPTVSGAQAVVGKFSSVRNAHMTDGLFGPGRAYKPVKTGEPVREGYGVRTFRRSFAEITFTDGSAIRVNEQTDLVVQSAKTLRRIRLESGALWVRDEKGSRTAVQTPVGTATARGTEFIITSDGTVTVKEGEVDLEGAGVTIVLGPGEVGGIGPGGTPGKLGLGDQGIPNEGATGGERGQPWYEGAGESGLAAPDVLGVVAGGGLLGVGLNRGSGDTNREPVPEPATMLALAAGAGLLIKRRLKR